MEAWSDSLSQYLRPVTQYLLVFPPPDSRRSLYASRCWHCGFCLCLFSQVRGTPAAAPRASGCMSAIPQFRWYQSQGYSTLRHICSSMRKSSNMTGESILSLENLLLLCVVFAEACKLLLLYLWVFWRQEKGRISLYTPLYYLNWHL